MNAEKSEASRLNKLRRISRKHIEWVVLPPFLLAAFLVGYVAETDRAELTELTARAHAAEDGQRVAWRLEQAVYEPVHLIRSLASLAEFDIDTFVRSFSKIASDMRQRNPEIINIAIAPNLVVSQVFPLKGNEMVLGLDFRSRPEFMSVVEKALENDEVILSGPLDSLQGPEVFIVRAPVILNRGTDMAREWGIVSVVFLASTVIDNLSNASELSNYSIAVQGLDRSAPNEGFFYGESDSVTENSIWQAVEVPGGEWQIAITPKSNWQGHSFTSSNPFRSVYTFAIAVGALSIFLLARLWRQRSEAEQLLNSAINAIEQGFVVFDAADRLLLHNQAYRNYYPFCQDILMPGVKFSDLLQTGVQRGQFPEAIGKEAEWTANKLYRHEQPHSEGLQLMPDGTWLKLTERRTDDGLSVGMRIDISELVEAQKMAEDALQVKSEFISVLSHELRTPLTVILGYAKVLSHIERLKSAKSIIESEDVTQLDFEEFLDQVRAQGDKIAKSGNHLLVLINDLLDYSKIEAGHLELNTTETSLGSLIADVVDGMSEMAADKGLKLEQESRDIVIEIDPIRAKQVLINLIGNAIKFTEAGGIKVFSEIHPGRVTITVEDTGCGIAHDDLNSVFDAFQQVDFSDKRKAGGTGLGLAISRQIMLLHGGEIKAKSVPGVGSKFSIEFPNQPQPITDSTRQRVSRLRETV